MHKIISTLEHNDTTYMAQLNTITKTTLGYEDHGVFTAYLSCQGDGTGIGVGGYVLDQFDPIAKERIGTEFGMSWIMEVMSTVGVDTWESLVGKKVFVLFEGTSPVSYLGKTASGIANIDSGEAMIFKEFSVKYFGEE